MKIDTTLLTIKIIYESDAQDTPFVAYIPEFDISSCGSSQDEAVQNVKEALSITLEEAKKDNTTGELLAELGFKPSKNGDKRFHPPRIIIEPFTANRTWS